MLSLKNILLKKLDSYLNPQFEKVYIRTLLAISVFTLSLKEILGFIELRVPYNGSYITLTISSDVDIFFKIFGLICLSGSIILYGLYIFMNKTKGIELKEYPIPKLKNEYIKRDDEYKIIQKLKSKKILQLYGISGIGKSELAKKISFELLSKEYKEFWINGDNIKDIDITLSSIHDKKDAINILELLKNKRIILILDNFNDNIKSIQEEFESSNKCGSLCIITSSSKLLSTDCSHKVDYLSDKISYKILGEKNDLSSQIISYCKGYPLILQHIKNAVDDGDYTWEKISNLIKEEKLSILDDERREDGNIAQRILSKLLVSMKDELEIIKIINSQNIAREFFEEVMEDKTNNSILKMKKKGIVEERKNSYYIHQILLDSISRLIENPDLEDYYGKLKSFLLKGNDNKNISYYNFIYINSKHIDIVYNQLEFTNELKKVILHTKIQNWTGNIKKWYIEEYEKYDLVENKKINILLQIEKIEIELYSQKFNLFYNKKTKEESEEKAKEKFKEISYEKIKILENRLEQNTKENINYIKHHMGKIYKNIEEYGEAIKLFNDVIDNDSNANYARLQLARIYTWYKFSEENKSELDKLISEILEKEYSWEAESLSTLLATYELISENKLSNYRKKYITDNFDNFFKNLLNSLSIGFEQPFQLLAKLAKHIAYIKPEEFKKICEEIPFPDKIESNKKIQYSFAVIQSIYFTILNSNEEKKTKKSAYESAELYFKSLKLSDYERGYYIDLYINAKNWSLAKDIIDTNYKIETPFDYQRLSKIEKGKANIDQSIEYINLAIEATHKEKNGEYKFIQYKYLMIEEKAEILFDENKIEDAIKNLEKSIELISDDKEKDDVCKELKVKLDNYRKLIK